MLSLQLIDIFIHSICSRVLCPSEWFYGLWYYWPALLKYIVPLFLIYHTLGMFHVPQNEVNIYKGIQSLPTRSVPPFDLWNDTDQAYNLIVTTVSVSVTSSTNTQITWVECGYSLILVLTLIFTRATRRWRAGRVEIPPTTIPHSYTVVIAH